MKSGATADARNGPLPPCLRIVTGTDGDGTPHLCAGELACIPVADLAALSQQHMDRYLSRVPSEDAYAFELFRRAICERDERAWMSLYAQYHLLLFSWLRRHPARPVSREDDEELVNRAFSRFWECVGPDRFHTFPNTAALLRYLKVCVQSVVLDDARRRQQRDRERAIAAGDAPDPAALVTEADTAAALWEAIAAELHNEADLLVARLCFVHGLPPREVYDRHPEMYASVEDVYRIKRNVLDRLRRNPAIRAFVEET